jgi:hypothetical protein
MALLRVAPLAASQELKGKRMLKKIFTHHFVIAGIIIFLLMFFIGIFGISLAWSEALLLAVVITVVGVGTLWWQDVWPF